MGPHGFPDYSFYLFITKYNICFNFQDWEQEHAVRSSPRERHLYKPSNSASRLFVQIISSRSLRTSLCWQYQQYSVEITVCTSSELSTEQRRRNTGGRARHLAAASFRWRKWTKRKLRLRLIMHCRFISSVRSINRRLVPQKSVQALYIESEKLSAQLNKNFN